MKKMHKNYIRAFCVSTFLASIIFSGNVFASDLNLQTTLEYEQWNQLESEEKENTLMPRTFSAKIPNEVFEEERPSLLNDLKGMINAESPIFKLQNVGAYTNSAYNLANELSLRIEHQGITQECWAFSTLKSLETNIAIKNGEKEIPNFSERHMDYATTRTFLDGINEKGFQRELKQGGLIKTALAYLTNGQGAVLESEMPFENNEEQIALSGIDKNVDTIVTDYITLPSINKKYQKDDVGNTISVTYTDSTGKEYTEQEVKKIRDTIKKHIVINGAIPSLTAANKQKFYNNSEDITKATAYHCNDVTVKQDHAITIVGWDDNYSKDNFPEGHKPSANGAYIVLNSYGGNVFAQGYLYVSYEDSLIEHELYGIADTQKKDFDNIYQSDFYGSIFSLGTMSRDTGYYANVYERDITKEEFITDVGVSVTDYVKLEIYINPANDSKDFSNLIKVGETKDVVEPGYHRIEITPTKLTGQKFAIVIKQKSENGIFYFAVETPVQNSPYACVNSENNSFYSITGNEWTNLMDLEISGVDMKKTDVCIKAFTVGALNNNTPDNPDDNEETKPDDGSKPDGETKPDEGETKPDDETKPDEGETKPDDTNKEDEITITSEKYLIEGEKIYKIIDETTISVFKSNIETNATIKILDEDKEVTEDNKIIKTGMKLKLNDTKEFELIVRGDLNCDGKVTITDLSKLILHYNETKGHNLTGNACDAADMNYDKKVTITDLSQMLVLYNSK